MANNSTTHPGILLPAGILPTVLIICLVITLFASALIGLAYFRHQLSVRDTIANQLSRNTESSLNYLLGSSKVNYHQPYRFDLYGSGNDSVQIEKCYWGLFDLVKTKAFRGVHHTSTYALVGKKPDAWGKASLYLADENRPLSLAGNTLITGPCFLPQAGVRAAYVEGRGFIGKQLIQGDIKTSNLTLPDLPEPLVNRLQHYGRLRERMPANSIPLSKAIHLPSFSFESSPINIHLPDEAILTNIRLAGNAVLISQGEVTITPSAQLEGLVILARKVIIQAGFTGSLQVLAQDTVVVEARCTFNYPSALVAFNQSGKSRIQLGEGSTLEGLLLVGSLKHESLNNTVVLNKDVVLEGQAYVDGMVELKGQIAGTLACRRFFMLTPTTLYENHLLDTEINVEKRSPYFFTSPLLSASPMGIVQWLE